MACRLRGGSCPKQPDAAAASCRVFQNSRGNTGGYPGPVCGWWLRAARFFSRWKKKRPCRAFVTHPWLQLCSGVYVAGRRAAGRLSCIQGRFQHTGAFFSWLCFFLAIVFFTAFITADKPSFRHTPIAWEGLWQRLTLLVCIFPWRALYLPCCKLREKGRPRHIIAGGRPLQAQALFFSAICFFSARSSAAEAGYTPKEAHHAAVQCRGRGV